ncbi:hypothetical protein BDQ17DRAFT_1426417 [Cyathus striatus]|nr:hypothetical protein BDQ17DRAFT_1426417 [Cyathus striatus]
MPGGSTPVTQLNNYLQNMQMSSELSWSEIPSGPAHAPTWTVQCKINREVKGVGISSSKQTAKNEAARQALQTLMN